MTDWKNLRKYLNLTQVAEGLGLHKQTVVQWKNLPDKHKPALAALLSTGAKPEPAKPEMTRAEVKAEWQEQCVDFKECLFAMMTDYHHAQMELNDYMELGKKMKPELHRKKLMQFYEADSKLAKFVKVHAESVSELHLDGPSTERMRTYHMYGCLFDIYDKKPAPQSLDHNRLVWIYASDYQAEFETYYFNTEYFARITK